MMKKYASIELLQVLKYGMRAVDVSGHYNDQEIVTVDSFGNFIWESEGNEVRLTHGFLTKALWAILPQEVTWQEALQAWVDGGTIKHEAAKRSGYCNATYNKDNDSLYLPRLSMAGKWYVIEGGNNG